jgi:mannan endo-1,4-beta-mannosidase
MLSYPCAIYGADAFALALNEYQCCFLLALQQGLDFAVSEAKKCGMRLILSFVNNWPDFGGRTQYASWAKELAGNANADPDDFYTDDTMRAWYRNHVKVCIYKLYSES